MILVSSCLAGMKVRYNGTDCLDERLQSLFDSGKAVSVCPELLGGLAVPREPAEIIGGSGEDVLEGTARVINQSGEDVTSMFLKGAYETLNKARELGATAVVLKENSPSCGSHMIYDGQFAGMKISGQGVTAALLRSNGIQVISEQQISTRLEALEGI